MRENHLLKIKVVKDQTYPTTIKKETLNKIKLNLFLFSMKETSVLWKKFTKLEQRWKSIYASVPNKFWRTTNEFLGLKINREPKHEESLERSGMLIK